MRRTADRRCRSVRVELALRRDDYMDERRGDRPENEEERALQEAADAACLDERAGEDNDGCLHDDVAMPQVGELVREDALELGGRRECEEALADGDCRSVRAPSDGERARVAVSHEVETRPRDARADGELLHG